MKSLAAFRWRKGEMPRLRGNRGDDGSHGSLRSNAAGAHSDPSVDAGERAAARRALVGSVRGLERRSHQASDGYLLPALTLTWGLRAQRILPHRLPLPVIRRFSPRLGFAPAYPCAVPWREVMVAYWVFRAVSLPGPSGVLPASLRERQTAQDGPLDFARPIPR